MKSLDSTQVELSGLEEILKLQKSVQKRVVNFVWSFMNNEKKYHVKMWGINSLFCFVVQGPNNFFLYISLSSVFVPELSQSSCGTLTSCLPSLVNSLFIQQNNTFSVFSLFHLPHDLFEQKACQLAFGSLLFMNKPSLVLTLYEAKWQGRLNKSTLIWHLWTRSVHLTNWTLKTCYSMSIYAQHLLRRNLNTPLDLTVRVE